MIRGLGLFNSGMFEFNSFSLKASTNTIINWQRLTLPPVKAVPSALVGLTSLFGMGRGGPHRYNHHKILHSVHSRQSMVYGLTAID